MDVQYAEMKTKMRQEIVLQLSADPPAGTAGTLNYVLLTGLKPDTVYYYVYGDVVSQAKPYSGLSSATLRTLICLSHQLSNSISV